MRALSHSTAWICVFCLLTAGVTPVAAEPPAKPDEKTTDSLFPFTISQETTRITEPLKPDGTPDYAAALNARLSQGVTPANNAGAVLIEVVGSRKVPQAKRKSFYQALGIKVPANPAGNMQDLGEFTEPMLKEKFPPDEISAELGKLWDQQSEAMQRPWSRKEFPVVAGWVDANADALKAAAEALKMPRLFIPLMGGDEEPLVSLPVASSGVRMRIVARLLSARAMLALGEGRIEDAQADLLACHRLASLLGQQATILESMVAVATDGVACRADRALMESDKVTAKQLSAYRKQLEQLPPLPKISEKIDLGGRFMFLDSIANLATQKMDSQAFGIGKNELIEKMLKLSIDWDLIMKRGNREYDKLVAAMNQPTYARRKAAIDKMEAGFKKLREESQKPAQVALMLLGADPPRQVVSRQMGNTLILLLIPLVQQAGIAELRGQANRNQTITALAIAEYKKATGDYPESLNALKPEYLKTIPRDPFSNQALKYQKQDRGYILYSIGPNAQDDKGQPQGETATSDDLVLQVPPRPEF